MNSSPPCLDADDDAPPDTLEADLARSIAILSGPGARRTRRALMLRVAVVSEWMAETAAPHHPGGTDG